MQPSLGRWDPLTPAGVAEVLSGFDRPWWIAGGWAIDRMWDIRRASTATSTCSSCERTSWRSRGGSVGGTSRPPTHLALSVPGAQGRCCRKRCMTSGVGALRRRRGVCRSWLTTRRTASGRTGEMHGSAGRSWRSTALPPVTDSGSSRPRCSYCTRAGTRDRRMRRIFSPSVRHLSPTRKRWLEAALSLVARRTSVARLSLTAGGVQDGLSVASRTAAVRESVCG